MFTTRRLAAGALVLATVAGLGLAVVYVERGPIGVRLATDYLRRLGVSATLRIDRLDTGGFSGAVSLGRADDPDFVVDRLDVTFDPLPIWRGGLAAPRIHAIRLVRPQIKARFDGRRLTFGSLQRLVDEAQRGPSGGPGPSVTVQDGRLNLDTPAGSIVVLGDGALDRGRIAWVSARLAPRDLQTSDARVEGLTGELLLHARSADRLEGRWRLAATAATANAFHAGPLDLDGDLDAPYARSGFDRLDGPIKVDTRARLRRIAGQGVEATDLRAHLSFAGMADGPIGALRFSGPGSAVLQAASAAVGGGSVSHPALTLDSRRLLFEDRAAGRAPRLEAPLHLTLTAQGGLVTAGRTSVVVGAISTQATGDVGASTRRWTLVLKGAAQMQAALGPVQARQVAHALVPAAAGTDLQEAMARNLKSARVSASACRVAATNDRVAIDLAQPLKAVFADGGVVEVRRRPGLAAIEVSGGVLRGGGALHLAGPGLPTLDARINRYRLSKGEGEAEVTLDMGGTVGPVRGGSFALQASVEDHGGRLQLFAHDCAKLSLDALENGADTVMRDVSLRVCPRPASPLLDLDGSRWSAAGRVEQVNARLPNAEVELSDLESDFSLHGKGVTGPVGHLTLAHARLVDAAKQPRFNALIATGAADLTPTSWRGGLDLGLPPTVPTDVAIPLGRLTLVHDPRTRRGTARFVSTLHFRPKGFQPANVAPQAREWLSDVQGDAGLSVEASWTDGRITDRAEVRTTALDLKSPAGPIGGLRGDLRFASLTPLRTEPNQQITIDRLDTLLPLTALSASFELDPTHLVLHQAGASIAGGRISLAPMSVALPSPGTAPIAQGALTLKDVDLGEVVKVLNLANAVSIQARIDGVLPFAFGPAGLRLSGGRVSADGPGRLTIRRQALTGASGAGGEAQNAVQNNAVQDFAYQALENLAFDSLEADVASRPQGRLGVMLHVKGRHDPPTAPVTRIGLIDLLRGHAFDRPIPLPKGTPVDLTLDSSLNFDELVAAYGGLRPASGSVGVQPGAPK